MKKTVSILMAVMMTVVFLFSGCAYAEGNSDDELEIILSNMTLREKVAQMMIEILWKRGYSAATFFTRIRNFAPRGSV